MLVPSAPPGGSFQKRVRLARRLASSPPVRCPMQVQCARLFLASVSQICAFMPSRGICVCVGVPRPLLHARVLRIHKEAARRAPNDWSGLGPDLRFPCLDTWSTRCFSSMPATIFYTPTPSISSAPLVHLGPTRPTRAPRRVGCGLKPSYSFECVGLCGVCGGA